MRLKPSAFSLAAAGLILVAAKAPEERRISYRMTPVTQAGAPPVLRVEMRFRGDADGETILHLPKEWAGSTELWRHVERLEIRGAESLGGFHDAPVIRHRPGAAIRVRYDIASAWDKDPGFAYEKARPMVRPDWFFFHGEGVFAVPAGRQAGPARFRWGKLPKGWTVASDLDHLRREKSTLANLVHSVAIGGADLSIVRRPIGNATLRVATRGKWGFEPEALADTVERIVETADAWWQEESTPFLVAMAPLGEVPTGLSYSGTGRTDAFSIASTSAFDLKLARRFLGHEYLHSWVPGMLGAMPEQGEPADYWFSEGFADYIAPQILLRAGLWTLDDYVADKNEALRRYGTSPVKTATAAEVAARTWSDRDMHQLSYDRGHLIAALLDTRIAARTDGKLTLRDILLAQRKAAKGSDALATELFQQTLRARADLDAAVEIDRFARRGESILLPADLFGDCARIVAERRKAFDRGFDSEATRRADGEIAGVDPAGPAYAAGMRDGMILVDRTGGTIGDSTVELAYRVIDEKDRLRVIRYLPQGKAEHEVQRMELTVQGDEQERRCRDLFSGKTPLRTASRP
jgi:predicted metalloprotease with PDZ domain